MGAFTLPTAAAACDEVADMLLLHGDVLTVDKSDSIAEAIAIRPNRYRGGRKRSGAGGARGGVEQFKNFNGLQPQPSENLPLNYNKYQAIFPVPILRFQQSVCRIH